jgi:hypothetical protein
LKWLEAEGPELFAPDASFFRTADYDYVIFFSYRYYHVYHGEGGASARFSCRRPKSATKAIGLDLLASFAASRRSAATARKNGSSKPFHTTTTCRAQSGHRIAIPEPATGSVPPEVRHHDALRCASADRPKQGLQRALLVLSERTTRRRRALRLVLIGGELLPVPEHPASTISGFSTTRTSSMRWPLPICC